MPDSYENFRCAIESRDDLPSPETLKIKLIEERGARKEKTSTGQNIKNEEAFIAKNNNYFKPKNNDQNSIPVQFKFKCHFCKKRGHKQRGQQCGRN